MRVIVIIYFLLGTYLLNSQNAFPLSGGHVDILGCKNCNDDPIKPDSENCISPIGNLLPVNFEITFTSDDPNQIPSNMSLVASNINGDQLGVYPLPGALNLIEHFHEGCTLYIHRATIYLDIDPCVNDAGNYNHQLIQLHFQLLEAGQNVDVSQYPEGFNPECYELHDDEVFDSKIDDVYIPVCCEFSPELPKDDPLPNNQDNGDSYSSSQGKSENYSNIQIQNLTGSNFFNSQTNLTYFEKKDYHFKEFIVYDLAGQKLMQNRFTNYSDMRQCLRELNKGLYIVLLKDEGDKYTFLKTFNN